MIIPPLGNGFAWRKCRPAEEEEVAFLSRLILVVSVGSLFFGLKIFSVAADEKESPAQDSLMRRQRAEFAGFYLKDPAAAKVPQASIAVEFYNQAVEFYRQREYELARQALTDSLTYDPKNSFAYELLGNIHDVKGELSQALEEYKKAYQLQPRKELRDRIEKLMHETTIEEEFVTFEDQHFVLKYQGEIRPDYLARIRKALKAAYEELVKDLGYYFKQPVIVLLYDQQEFREITRLPHWVRGFYDGKIRIPAHTYGMLDLDLEAQLAHEMTHAVVSGISEGQAPAWLQEGLAVYEENKVKKSELIVFNAAVKTNRLLSLDQLISEKEAASGKDSLLAGLFYEQSFQWVDYLVRHFGMAQIKQMLVEFSKGKDSDEVLRTHLKKPLQELEREWKTSLIN